MSARRCMRRCATRRVHAGRVNCSLTLRQVGKWTAALGNRKFMGGDRPNLAGAHVAMHAQALRLTPLPDISFFGVLRAVHTFDTFKDVMANTTLQPWCGTIGALASSGRLSARRAGTHAWWTRLAAPRASPPRCNAAAAATTHSESPCMSPCALA